MRAPLQVIEMPEADLVDRLYDTSAYLRQIYFRVGEHTSTNALAF